LLEEPQHQVLWIARENTMEVDRTMEDLKEALVEQP
jgi:hypothetical protein